MSILRRIPHHQLVGFYFDHYTQPNVRMAYESQPLRLGQAFLNQFFPGVTDHSLFYEESDEIAREMIESHYVAMERMAA